MDWPLLFDYGKLNVKKKKKKKKTSGGGGGGGGILRAPFSPPPNHGTAPDHINIT